MDTYSSSPPVLQGKRVLGDNLRAENVFLFQVFSLITFVLCIKNDDNPIIIDRIMAINFEKNFNKKSLEGISSISSHFRFSVFPFRNDCIIALG